MQSALYIYINLQIYRLNFQVFGKILGVARTMLHNVPPFDCNNRVCVKAKCKSFAYTLLLLRREDNIKEIINWQVLVLLSVTI